MTRIGLDWRVSVSSFAILVLSLLWGCGDDECSVGESRCLTDVLIRTCVKGDEGDPEWITHACADGTSCIRSEQAGGEPEGEGGSGGSSGAEGPDGGTAADETENAGGSDNQGGEGDRCVGVCQNGVAECVTDELSRYCVDGREWALDACQVGENCDSTDGRCKLADAGEGILVCEPGAKACVSEDVEKECDADGSGWRLAACRFWEICTEETGECQPDPNQSCDPTGGGTSGYCVDSKTAVRCNAITGGYELVTCEGDTYCANGRCRGENCSIGSTCLGAPAPQATNPAAALPTQILECLDGVNEIITECAMGQVCRQNGDYAECVPPECTVDASVCGDPNDTSVDATQYYSACVIGDNSGVPEWKLTECRGNLVCDPTVGGGNLCRSECTPGAQVCARDADLYVVSGSRECQEDGTWGPIVDCNPGNDSQLVCMNVQEQEAGALNQVVCADPVCADIAANPAAPVDGVERVQGVCVGAQIRTCGADGRLQAEAVDCETGVCRNVGTPQGDGQIRGICDVVVDCEEGETLCLASGAAPFYRNCVNRKWGTELVRCDGDNTCWDSVNAQGQRSASCGGDCSPGSTRCDPDDETGTQMQRCQDDGQWADAQDCALGLCQLQSVLDPTADDGRGAMASQVNCVLQCVPDQVYCDVLGESKTADDGYHTGYAQTRTCKSNGLWPAPFDPEDPDQSPDDYPDQDYFHECGETEACRISGSGHHTGCIECIGPDIPGGNEHGYADTTCEDEQFKACGADNTWDSPAACADGTTCSPPRPTTPICLPCTSGAGVELEQCSAALINDTEVCGACERPGYTIPVPYDDLEVCSAENVAAVQVCGECPTPGGALAVCTETSIDDLQICPACYDGEGIVQVAQCTDTNLRLQGNFCDDCLLPDGVTRDQCTLTNTGDCTNYGGSSDTCGSVGDCCLDYCLENSCDNLDYGDPSGLADWGTTGDCCPVFRQYQEITCQDGGYGVGSQTWGGVDECCANFQYDGRTCDDILMASTLGLITMDWGGVDDCCYYAREGTTTTCSDVGVPGSYGPWGGVDDCCAAAQDTLPEQEYARCVSEEDEDES